MPNSQFSLKSLLSVTGLVAALLGLGSAFRFLDVVQWMEHSFFYGLRDSFYILLVAISGLFIRSSKWFIVSLAFSAAALIVNCGVIDGFWRTGTAHWWMFQPAFGFGLAAILNRLADIARAKDHDWLIKTGTLCLGLGTALVALCAVFASMGFSGSSAHGQWPEHLEFTRVFAGCLAYTVFLTVVWEFTAKNVAALDE